MTRATRSMRVFDDTFMILKRARQKYRKPISEIVDTLVMQTQALSELDRYFEMENTTNHYKQRKGGDKS